MNRESDRHQEAFRYIPGGPKPGELVNFIAAPDQGPPVSGFAEGYLTSPGDAERLTRIFKDVIRWSNELSEQDKEAIRQANAP